MKKCARCGVEKQLSDFNKCASKKDGLHSYCRKCNSDVRNAWRKKHPDKTLEETRRQRASNPLAASARGKLGHAVCRGKIDRPGNCQLCGRSCIPHGHHPNYHEPLTVYWLCQQCHNHLHYHISGLNKSISQLKGRV